MSTLPNLKLVLLAFFLGCMFLGQCHGQETTERFPGKEWQRYRQIEDAGFSADKLMSALRRADLSQVAGLAVVHDGALVLRYGDIETRYMCHSVRKSLMSLLFGMYDIDLTQTLAELGIDDSSPLTESEKKATIGDLIRSRSGVYHPAAYEPPTMKRTRPKRGSHEPGTHWWYNNWDFNTLLTIFEQETGEKFFEAFQKRIAEPLQLQDFRLRDGYYHREPSSIHPAYPFRLSARDLARIGWLVASEGKWQDKQIVPSEWIAESLRPHSTFKPVNGYRGYGYLWWIANQGKQTIISALGTGNNTIDIVPDRNLVFVFRADTFKGKNISHKVRWQIINSIIAAQDRPPNPNAELATVTTENPWPKTLTAIQLGEDYLRSFPLELSRQLPDSLPEAIRNQTVRIERPEKIENGSELVMFTQAPPSMQLDLLPLAEDRFWIEGLNEIAVIERSAENKPTKLLLKNDLLACVQVANKEGDEGEFNRLSSILRTHFDYTVFNPQKEITAGIKKLIALQEESKKWPYEGNYRVAGKTPLTYEVGGTSLVCLALMYGAEVSDKDARTAFNHGLDFVLAQLDDPQMATSRKLEYDMRVLAQAYSLLLLSHIRNQYPDHGKAAEIQAGIRQLTGSLVEEQMEDGGWNYQGRPVHASFVTASVVQALLWANHPENKVASEVFDRATKALNASRFDDGGIRYFGTEPSHPKRERQDLLPGSIGRAAICETMLFVMNNGSINRTQRSIDAFHRYWDELEKRRKMPGTHEGPFLIASYYFYYGHRYVAQAIELLPESRRPAERDRLYQLFSKTKDDDGTWNDRVFSRSKSYGTAMVLLALLSPKIGTPPEIPDSKESWNAIQRPAKYRSDPSKVMMKNVYVMLSDRTIRNASPTPGEGFYGGGCIHPEGKDVIFPGATWGYARIWKYTIATGKVEALTPATYASINPSYSSDGKQIVFAADRDLDNPRFDMFEVGRSKPHNAGFRGGISSASNLYIMDADGQNIRQLTTGNHYDTRPSFSPDGKTIVFLSSRGANTLHMWTVASDGSSEPVKLKVDGNPWAGRPRYSVDGEDLFFFSGIEDGKYVPTGRHTLCRVSSTGGKWQPLANDTVGVSSHGPDPDPDRKHLWYHAAENQLWGIYKLPLEGGDSVKWIPPGFHDAHTAHPTVSRNGVISFDSRSFIETNR